MIRMKRGVTVVQEGDPESRELPHTKREFRSSVKLTSTIHDEKSLQQALQDVLGPILEN